MPPIFDGLPPWLRLLFEITIVLQFINAALTVLWTCVLTYRRLRRRRRNRR